MVDNLINSILNTFNITTHQFGRIQTLKQVTTLYDMHK